MADIRARALSCLRDGRVTVTCVRPPRVIAKVRSSRLDRDVTYVVDRWEGAAGDVEWDCTCQRDECAHRAAVALVTYPTESAAYRERATT